MEITLDHVVIAVSDWARSNAFYGDVLGADVVELAPGQFAYRLGGQQLNVHGPDSEPFPVARERVRPGNSDLCFEWPGPVEAAAAHLQRHGVEIELGPSSAAVHAAQAGASMSATRTALSSSSSRTHERLAEEWNAVGEEGGSRRAPSAHEPMSRLTADRLV